MTTLQMHTASNFEASATEDPMELTSDMDRRFGADEDIDIDLDLTADNHQYEEDEYMGEDVNVFTDLAPVNEPDTQAGNDDEMADDNYAEGSIAGRSSVRDEDLEDADDAGLYPNEDTVVEAHLEHDSHVDQNPLDSEAQISSNYGQNPDYQEQPSTFEEASSTAVERLLDGQKDLIAPVDTSGLLAQELSQELSQAHEEDTSRYEVESNQSFSKESHQEYEEVNSRQESFRHEHSTEIYSDNSSYVQEANAELPEKQEEVRAPSKEEISAPETSENARTEEYQSGTNEASSGGPTHVHPVIVIYQDNEISLFPPINEDDELSNTYFLQDENLAGESIKTLFGALRSVLGESISDQEELTIDINDLDLHISESTIESSTTTLLQVLDLYIHLQHHDGFETAPTFYINLTTRTSFSHRLEFLLNAVIEGKGLSQLRSSELADEIQHPELDGDQGHDREHASHTDNATGVAEAGVLEHEVIAKPWDTHNSNDSQSKSPTLTESAKTVESATQNSAPSTSGDIASRMTDNAEAHAKIQEPIDEEKKEEANTEAVKPHTEDPNLSLPSTAGGEVLQKPNGATIDEEDSIEYEDDEEVAHGTSTGSSTLQGDVFYTIPVLGQAEIEESGASARAEELNSSSKVLEIAVAGEGLDEYTVDEKAEALGDEEDPEAVNSGSSDPNNNSASPFPAQTKLQSPTTVKDNETFQIDDDEITYEEEDDVENLGEPANTERDVASSPRSLKRARSLREDHEVEEDDPQGAKRVRSG